MWAFSRTPPTRLIYGTNQSLLCCRMFFGWASIIIIRQKKEHFWSVPDCFTGIGINAYANQVCDLCAVLGS